MGNQEFAASAGELINLAVVAARQRQLAQALDLFGQALASPGATPDLVAKALFNRGVIYAAVNLPQKALQDFDSALATPELEDADRARALIARASALSKLGHSDLAVSTMLSFMAYTPTEHPLFRKAQQSLETFRRERDARDPNLSRLAGQIKSRVMGAQSRAQAQFDRALILGDRGDWVGALDDYDHLLAQPSLSPSLRAMCLTNRGVLRAGAGRIQEAQTDYQDALAESQGGAQAHGNALNNWGLLLLANGQVMPAIDLFSKGLALPDLPAPVSLLLMSNRAVAYGHAGQPQARCADLDALLRRDDVSAHRKDGLRNQRGLVRMQLGDLPGAQADFLEIVAEPIRHLDQAALAYNNLGVAMGRLNQSDQAIAYFSQAIDTPNAGAGALSNAHFNRGAAFASQGKTNEALADYASAIAQGQGDRMALAMALNNRAMLLADLDEDGAAWADLVTLLTMQDADPVQRIKAYVTQARIGYKRGQWDEVVATAQSGLREAESTALRLMEVMAKVWKGDVVAARENIESLRQRPDATIILSQFRLDLEQARNQGLPKAHLDAVLDLLPASGATAAA